jgi:hypothetical protein
MGNLSWLPKRTIKKYVRAGRGDQGVQGGRERWGFGLFFPFFSDLLETIDVERRRMDRWMDGWTLTFSGQVCEPRTQGGMAAAGACPAVKQPRRVACIPCTHGESSIDWGAGCPVLRRLVPLSSWLTDRETDWVHRE